LAIEACDHLVPRHYHPLQPRLRIITAHAVVENHDPETAAAIAMRAAQPKLQSKTSGLLEHSNACKPGNGASAHYFPAKTAALESASFKTASKKIQGLSASTALSPTKLCISSGLQPVQCYFSR
jgi:hypothetical protein